MSRRSLAVILLLSWIATACATTPVSSTTANDGAAIESVPSAAGVLGTDSPPASPSTPVPPPATAAPRQPVTHSDAGESQPSPASSPADERPARTDLELPPARIGFDSLIPEDTGPVPVSLAIDSLDIDDAGVIAVGVNPDESFEVPPADLVGWYEFGPAPGEAGSAVLAAHINYNGEDGVFRYLIDAEVGAIVEIGFDDGTMQRYRIESVTDYVKEELPAELFSRTGDSSLALITCGGAFNPQLRSYDSNTVAIAVPI